MYYGMRNVYYGTEDICTHDIYNTAHHILHIIRHLRWDICMRDTMIYKDTHYLFRHVTII